MGGCHSGEFPTQLGHFYDSSFFFCLELLDQCLKVQVSDHGEGFMLIPRLSLTNMHNNAYALGMLTGQRFLDPYFIDAVRVIRIYSSTQLLPLFA